MVSAVVVLELCSLQDAMSHTQVKRTKQSQVCERPAAMMVSTTMSYRGRLKGLTTKVPFYDTWIHLRDVPHILHCKTAEPTT